MSIFQQSLAENTIYFCTFQCFIGQALISMKFPCSYLIEWSADNKQAMVSTDNYSPKNNKVLFNTKISMSIDMVFDRKRQQYLKRQTSIELLLISKNRPDKKKLVGKINVDLAKIANFNMYEEQTKFKLDFNSAEGSLAMQFKLTDRQISENEIIQMYKSARINRRSQSLLPIQPKNQNTRSYLFSNKCVVKERKEQNYESVNLKIVSPSHKYQMRIFADLNQVANNKRINGSLSLDSDQGRHDDWKNLANIQNVKNIKSSIISKEEKVEEQKLLINPTIDINGIPFKFEEQQIQIITNSQIWMPRNPNKLVKSARDCSHLQSPDLQKNKNTKAQQNVKTSQKSINLIENRKYFTQQKKTEDKTEILKSLETYQSLIRKYTEDYKFIIAEKTNLEQQISVFTQRQRTGNQQKAKLYEFLEDKDKIISQLYEGLQQKIEKINKLQIQISQCKSNKNVKNNDNRNMNLQKQNTELRDKIVKEANIAEIRRIQFCKLQVLKNNLQNQLIKYSQIADSQKNIKTKLQFQLELSGKSNNQLNEKLINIDKKMEEDNHVLKLQNYQKIHQLRIQISKKDELIDEIRHAQSETRSLYVKTVRQLQDLQSKWSQLSKVHRQEKQKVNELANDLKQLAQFGNSQQLSFQQENMNISLDPCSKIKSQQNYLSISQSIKKHQTLNNSSQNWEQMYHQNQLKIDQLNAYLEQQINRYNKLQQQYTRQLQKTSKMKSTLIRLQQQSKQICSMVQQKQQNEEIYIKTIEELELQICELRAIFNAESESSPSVIYPDGSFELHAPADWVKMFNSRESNKIKDKFKKNNLESASNDNLQLQFNSQLNQYFVSPNNPQIQKRSKFKTQTSEQIFDPLLNMADKSPMFIPKYQSVQKFTKTKDNQSGTWKYVKGQKQIQFSILQKEIIRLKTNIDKLSQQKLNLQKLIKEKDNQITELSQKNKDIFYSFNKQHQKRRNQQQLIVSGIQALRQTIKDRNLPHNFELSLNQFISQGLKTQQTTFYEQNVYQKIKVLSKELKKIKCQILKLNWRNQNEKIKIMDLFQNFQSMISEITCAFESINLNQISYS